MEIESEMKNKKEGREERKEGSYGGGEEVGGGSEMVSEK